MGSEEENIYDALNREMLALNEAMQTPEFAGQTWTAELVQYLAISVLAFTFVTLIMCTALLWKREATPLGILRVFGIMSIIGVSAVLLVVGYSSQQLTPIVGLFGAIAGYLLGKDTSKKPEDVNPAAASGNPGNP